MATGSRSTGKDLLHFPHRLVHLRVADFAVTADFFDAAQGLDAAVVGGLVVDQRGRGSEPLLLAFSKLSKCSKGLPIADGCCPPPGADPSAKPFIRNCSCS